MLALALAVRELIILRMRIFSRSRYEKQQQQQQLIMKNWKNLHISHVCISITFFIFRKR